MRQLAAMERVTAAFAAAGVRSLVLKGLPLGQRIYGRPFLKSSIDIDLLVPEGAFADAADTLRALTWTAVGAGAWTPSPAVTYTVYRAAGGTVEAAAAGVRGAGYTDRGVEPGGAYVYQVAAAVDGGEGSRSGLAAVELPCAYTVTPLHRDVLWPAGTGEVVVTTGSTCGWTAASESGFLTVTAGASGTGSGTVTYAVAANAGGPRTGSLLVAGRQVTVFQASPTVFTDHPIEARVTPVRAIHFLELRARIDALRTRVGLGRYGWTDRALVPGVTPVKVVHLTELRAALAQVYLASGRPAPVYTDTALAAGTGIRAGHLMELRAAVAALGTWPPRTVVARPGRFPAGGPSAPRAHSSARIASLSSTTCTALMAVMPAVTRPSV